MKKAIIVVGEHHSGKSLTINEHLKPLLGISYHAHKFTLAGKNGWVLSQTFEESLRDFLAMSQKYFAYDLLVCAARPKTESGSQLNLIRHALQKASFIVEIINISEKGEAPEKANEVFNLLNSIAIAPVFAPA